MTTRTIKAYEHHCERCDFLWRSYLKNPKKCHNVRCRSPHWRKKADPSLGGKKGGPARAKALSSERRREIASLGGKERMEKRSKSEDEVVVEISES